MDVLLPTFFGLLVAHGVWILFLLAVAETCFVTGLVVPSGAATSLATVLALRGDVELASVAMAAVGGGIVGDSVGFWVGRVGGRKLRDGEGIAARVFRRRRGTTRRFFGRHPFYSVTVARLVSFVRTLMPMAAGMSDIAYRRYLPYDLLGVLAWAAIYIAIGIVARESWRQMTSIVGAGWTAVLVLLGLGLWFRSWWRARHDGPAATRDPAC